ncbi:MAG: gamma-glutamylputrescine oxidase [Gaiellaceae bacterium]|nr:gamma-glutamylputrescine oxidase [Gaiellaceae bacterium]
MSSYWLSEERSPLPATTRSAHRVDVAIVGGGVTGCSCALTLAEAGKRVRLFEAREIAGGASGRNGGFALRGGAPAYDVARRELGPERARSLWELTERSLDRLEELGGDAFRRTGSLRLAADPDERAELEAEHEALREDGFAVEWRDELPEPLRGRFHGAIFHPPDGSLQPARWVRRLAARAAEAGADLREHERVEALDALDAEQVVIATDGYTRGLLPELDAFVKPTRGQVIVTEPLERQLYPRPHYARHGYDYWQQTSEGRLVAGGFRDKALDHEYTADEETTPLIQGHLEQFVADLLGAQPAIEHRWAGIFGTSEDRLPLVGPFPGHDGVWVAAGYSGHGNVLGLACGDLVARAILGDPGPELELFEPARFVP